MKKKLLTAGSLLVFTLAVVGSVQGYIIATIMSCDDAGVGKDVYGPGESVYACGKYYLAEEEVTVYVVPNGLPHTATDSIFSTDAQADIGGRLGPVDLGSFPFGEYDIWVDRDDDGSLDFRHGEEPVDTMCSVAGFLMIPEYMVGTVLGLVACFAAFAVFSKSRRSTQPRTS